MWPLYYTLPIPLYTSLVIYYHLAAPQCKTEKQRAYLLSAFSASIMSCLSLPFFWYYSVRGLGAVYQAGQDGMMGVLGEIGVICFGVYLFADLSLGYLKYPSQIGILTGWVHHTVYIALMIYCLNTGQSPIFLTCAVMEIPTLDLALSNLFPSIRNDLRFLSSFFLIRIIFNIIILVDCLRPSSRAVIGRSWVPAITLFLAGILHISWFQGGVIGYMKRQERLGKVTINLAEPVGRIEPELDGNPETEPGTPEDSPLVTPRHTPLSLRDSYLPTLVIPSISSLSLPALPSFPTTDINFGFKDAVKARGVNLKLHLGAMDPRRRFRGNREPEHAREEYEDGLYND